MMNSARQRSYGGGFATPGASPFGNPTPNARPTPSRQAGSGYEAYRPGRAAPTQPQGHGTAYGQRGDVLPMTSSKRFSDFRDHNFDGYDDRDQPGGENTPFMRPQGRVAAQAGQPAAEQQTQRPFIRPPVQGVSGDPRGGFAGMQPSYRPPPFQVNPSQTPWGQSADPFTERQAVIEQLNNQRMQRQLQYNRVSGGQNAAAPAGGQFPSLDFAGAVRAAGLGDGSPSLGRGGTWMDMLNRQFAEVPQGPLAGLFGQPQGGAMPDYPWASLFPGMSQPPRPAGMVY